MLNDVLMALVVACRLPSPFKIDFLTPNELLRNHDGILRHTLCE